MAQLEAKVLKPRDPNVRNNEDLPQAVLHDGEVRNAKTNELVSILAASSKTPITMTGKLIPSPDNKNLFLRHVKGSTVVQITNVTEYSYGQIDDSSFAAWGLGKAAWFEIRPSKAYTTIHNDTLEAIELMYTLQDTRDWDGRDVSAKRTFEQYADGHRNCRNYREAAELFYKHRVFIAQVMEGEDKGQRADECWSATPIYKHMASKFPDLFGSISDLPSKTGLLRNQRHVSIRSTTASTTSSRKRDFQPTGPNDEELEGRAKALWKFILETYKKLTPDLDLEGFATELHILYGFEDVEQASNYLSALAPQFIALMDRSRICDWTATDIYQSLSTTKLPAVSRKRALQLSPEPRPPKEVERLRRLHDGESSDRGTSSEESVDESFSRPKSALRPKGGKFADKGAKRRSRHHEDSPEDSEINGGVTIEDMNSPTKRKAEESKQHTRAQKRRAHHTDGVNERDTDDGTDESGSAAPDTIELPLRRKTETSNPPAVSNGSSNARRDHAPHHNRNTRSNPRPPSPLAVPPIATQRVASDRANGPGDTWVCGEDGCSHKVYGAAKALGKRLIREHIREHEEQEQAERESSPMASKAIHEGALDLIRAEEEMCNLPVGNLIRRIRDLAATQGGPPAFPAPIERRY